MKSYETKSWAHLSKFKGFSADQIEEHLKLYAGYIKNLNTLQEITMEKIQKGTTGTPEYNEIKRRFGWEYNGVRLHEYYFENLDSGENFDMNSELAQKIKEDFGSFENFINDFKKSGAMRGIGWVILYQDQLNGNLFNVWIDDHDSGHESGSSPLLVMDVWEHAYCVDWKPTERPKYIEAFCENIRWSQVETRFKKSKQILQVA